MEILPKTLGTRPRLAVEIRAGRRCGARGQRPSRMRRRGLLAAVCAGRSWGRSAVEPGLQPGNLPDAGGGDRGGAEDARGGAARRAWGGEVTLVVPDAAVRVLLLDFDTLPAKAAEALPVVRFRLKKLLPFDADDAQVSYQVMVELEEKALVRVVAVAMPREVLEEYEGVVREAGFEPGAVLPSTLAALAGLDEAERPALVVNAGRRR